jgi:hypothetical protein
MSVRLLRPDLCPHCGGRRVEPQKGLFRPVSQAASWLRYPSASGGIAEICGICQDAVERDEKYWGQPWETRL